MLRASGTARGRGPYDGPADGAVILSLGSPFIIGQDLIDVYEGRVINSHGSLLPEWRGGGALPFLPFSRHQIDEDDIAAVAVVVRAVLKQ